MFLKLIRDFFIKKSIKKSLLDYKLIVTDKKIKSIGLLIDETYFSKEKELFTEIIANGIADVQVEILVFKDRITKKDTFDSPNFSLKDVTVRGEFKKQEVDDFMARNFDMLISYYDIEKPVLKLVTVKSKSDFKVGFAAVDKKLNNFMIGTIAENHQEFVNELFKYLKILNKI